MQTLKVFFLCFATAPGLASIGAIELTPTDLQSAHTAFFTTAPTTDPALFFGADFGDRVRRVDFNSAPDGPLVEGGSVTTQYASYGVTMNDIRVSANIYGGNNYGAGFATEDNGAQTYTFSNPVVAVGIVNTSPDRDLIQLWAGPGGTGALLLEFRDQEGLPLNFNIDRFLGAHATGGTTIRSITIQNASGDLELDELIFVVACPADTNGDGVLNFFDVQIFLNAYSTGDPAGDFNNDTLFNFFDVSAYLAAYSAGCP